MRKPSNTLTSICLWHGQSAKSSGAKMLLKHAACTVFYFRAKQKNCAATGLEATLENCNLLTELSTDLFMNCYKLSSVILPQNGVLETERFNPISYKYFSVISDIVPDR